MPQRTLAATSGADHARPVRLRGILCLHTAVVNRPHRLKTRRKREERDDRFVRPLDQGRDEVATITGEVHAIDPPSTV
jgi:hypothetical protein